MSLSPAVKNYPPRSFDQVAGWVRLYGSQYPTPMADLIRSLRRDGQLTAVEAARLLAQLPEVQS